MPAATHACFLGSGSASGALAMGATLAHTIHRETQRKNKATAPAQQEAGMCASHVSLPRKGSIETAALPNSGLARSLTQVGRNLPKGFRRPGIMRRGVNEQSHLGKRSRIDGAGGSEGTIVGETSPVCHAE